MKILIVEDEIIVATSEAALIQSWGHKVCDTVANGEDAIIQARKLKPDLILMDINLQGKLSGIETARQLREFGIPVIFITGYIDEKLRRQAISLKPAGYLHKPVNYDMLRSLIASLR